MPQPPQRRAPAPARGPLSDLWRPDARRHAAMDLHTATLSIPAERHDVCPDDRGATRCGPPTAPVRPPPALRPRKPADGGSATACQRPADASRGSTDAPMAMPHHGVRRTLPALS